MKFTRRNFLSTLAFSSLAGVFLGSKSYGARKNFAGVNEIKNARGNIASETSEIFNAAAQIPESENDVENLLLQMSQNYVVKSVLSVPKNLNCGAFLDAEKAKAINEKTYKLTLNSNLKLLPCSILPLANESLALAEMQRTKSVFGFFGAIIPTQLNGKFLEFEKLSNIFKMAQSLDMPIFVAPQNGLENPVARDAEIGLFASQIASNYKLKNFKDLKIVLPSMGGSLLFTLARNLVRADDEDNLLRKSYLENFYYICGETYNDSLFDIVKRSVEVSKLLFGASENIPLALENMRRISHFEKILKGSLI